MAEHHEHKFDERKVRIEKLEKIKEQGVVPYPRSDFKPNTTSTKLTEAFGHLSSEHIEKEQRIFKYAGRIVMIRDFGKGGFLLLADSEGRFQAFISKQELTEKEFFIYKHLDIGDFVGVEGKCFKTKTGDLAIHTVKLVLMSKALRPLPEKFHGLTDVEARYRHRYLDLIVNPESKEVFKKRSFIVNYIRNYLADKNFLEVETPMMQPIPGGAVAKPFVTHHNALGLNLYMRIAPELYLKRLLVGGLERVFELNRNFRNEGISTFHNPEFTMLEVYMAYCTYEDHIELVEDMV
ncbi:MAG: amino acid--tRNA ligase-related protein, partial [Pseudomonadota bacterium]